MDTLRTPLFIIAAIVMLVAVLVEMGSTSLIPNPPVPAAGTLPSAADTLLKDLSPADRATQTARLASQIQSTPKPPGIAIPDMALLDGVMLFTVFLMAMPFLYPERFQGITQGILTLIFSILVILGGIVLAIAAFVKVMIMVGLFLAIPFGTLAYLAMWGFFNTGGAQAALSLLMILKLAFAVLLIFAQQGFLKNKGLVLIILTSLLANFLVGLLQNIVPSILVSITDGIAAIIVLILAIIWALFLLIGSVISIVKAI